MPSMPKKSKYKPKQKQKSRSVSNNHLYNDPEWRKHSKQFRIDNPLCACGCGRPSEEVDHIIPINIGGSMWDKRNHQALSKHCHFRKSGRESHKMYEEYIFNDDGEKIPSAGPIVGRGAV
jgi:5-methylcytosine-specific restriction protein A